MNRVMQPSFPGSLPMDPRIRRRRIEVRRHEGRRRLRVLVLVMVVVLLTVSGWMALRSPVLDIDAVEVEGAARTPAELVRRTAGVPDGAPMIDIDEARAARLLEALPWVEEATVERRWPGTVQIEITERKAQAVVGREAGGWELLDRRGRVLEVVPDRPAGLLPIVGIGPSGGPGSVAPGSDGALAVVAAVSPSLASRVEAVAVIEGGDIELRLKPQGTVRFGPPSDIEPKLRTIETVLARVDLQRLEQLDVRLPASPVLTRA